MSPPQGSGVEGDNDTDSVAAEQMMGGRQRGAGVGYADTLCYRAHAARWVVWVSMSLPLLSAGVAGCQVLVVREKLATGACVLLCTLLHNCLHAFTLIHDAITRANNLNSLKLLQSTSVLFELHDVSCTFHCALRYGPISRATYRLLLKTRTELEEQGAEEQS